MNWYYRTLLSYAPIFFVLISALIFAVFLVLNKSAHTQVLQTRQTVTQQVMMSLDAHLKSVERAALKEMLKEGPIKSFFGNSPPDASYDLFLVSQSLHELSSLLPFTNSIYIYNAYSEKVMTKSGLFALEEFADSDFLRAHQQLSDYALWSEPRRYRELNFELGYEDVVSLVKPYPISAERQGSIVINLRVSALKKFLQSFSGMEGGQIHLYDQTMQPLLTRPGLPSPEGAALAEMRDEHGPVYSAYTGWSLWLEPQKNKGSSALNNLYNLWVILGVCVVIGSLVWFTYVTHRHYLPIQTLVGKISKHHPNASEADEQRDNELKYIERAIHGLLDKTSQYERNQREDMIMRRNQMLSDLLEGNRVYSELEWRNSLIEVEMYDDFRYLSVLLIEIDQYDQFVDRYSIRDQSLLKFVISNVLQETVCRGGIKLWDRWLEPHQLGGLLFWQDACDDVHAEDSARRLQQWVNGHLTNITVSVALGEAVHEVSEVHRSLDQARKQLRNKPAYSRSRLCKDGDKCAVDRSDTRMFAMLPLIQQTIAAYRLADADWRDRLGHLFEGMEEMAFSEDELRQTMDYFLYQLLRDSKGLPDPIRVVIEDEYVPKLEHVPQQVDSWAAYRRRTFDVLDGLEKRMQGLRAKSQHDDLLQQVKLYISLNFHNPDLSLYGLSEAFSLNSRYLSKLFREKYGEKFIDYLLRVRMEHAQQLLEQSDQTVQEISERVGYLHVISFHRAFKKIYGIPPGDYRRQQRMIEL